MVSQTAAMANEGGLEAILVQDPHVVRIHPTEKWNLPSLDDIDYSLWENGIDIKRSALERLYRFLNEPYIEDNFENHELRRKLSTQMDGRYPNGYYEDNVLTINTMQVVQSAMRLLRGGYKGSRKEEFEALARAAHQISEETVFDYNSKPTQEKVNAARLLKYAVYDVIMFLYNQSARTANEAPQ